MPKSRFAPKARGRKGGSQRVKFKIGGRKSTKSALTCPADELKAARPRDKAKIERARKIRGLD